MAFITPFGAFCYTSMSFGLKNAGATYQRAIQTCLADHWGKRVEAYVDDVVIKTEDLENFIEDLQLVFNSLRRYRWKLNPEKCVFGVPAGKLLGFIVSHRGIEANPEKIEAIIRMEAPRSQKKVQRLTGWEELLKYIYKKGHRKIAYIHGQKNSNVTRERLTSFRRNEDRYHSGRKVCVGGAG